MRLGLAFLSVGACAICTGSERSDHVTPLLHGRLHWPRVPERIGPTFQIGPYGIQGSLTIWHRHRKNQLSLPLNSDVSYFSIFVVILLLYMYIFLYTYVGRPCFYCMISYHINCLSINFTCIIIIMRLYKIGYLKATRFSVFFCGGRDLLMDKFQKLSSTGFMSTLIHVVPCAVLTFVF